MKAFELISIVAGVLICVLFLSNSALANGAGDSVLILEGAQCEIDTDCGKLQFCDKSMVHCAGPELPECGGPTDTECIEYAKKAKEKNTGCVPGPINECRNFPENSCLTVSDCDGSAYECHYLENCNCSGSAGDGGSFQEECVCSTNEYGTCLLKMENCETASDCTGDFEGYECVDTLVSGHCFLRPDGFVGYKKGDDDTALCLGGLLLTDSVCAPEFAVKPPSDVIGVPVHGGPANLPPTDDPAEGKSAQNSGANGATGGGCTMGAGSPASALYLPLLMGLMLLAVRRRVDDSA